MERIVYLAGEQVSLVVPEKQDVDVMYKAMNTPEITKYLGTLRRFYLENEISYYDSIVKDQTHFFVIMKNDTKEIIGGLGFHENSDLNRNAIMGITLYNEDVLGKGFGTEAMKLFLKYTFEIVGYNKLKLNVYDFNERGQKSYLKCGFKEVGRLKQDLYIRGEYRDTIIMEIMRSEYEELYKK